MHRRWSYTNRGYADFGRIRIPPLPPNIVLTDRADGSLWHLSFTTSSPGPDGLGYITLNSAIPAQPDKRIYRAFEEPALDVAPEVRLFVRGGYLGMEVADPPGATRDRDQMPIHARVSLQRTGRRIIIPAGWTEFEALGGDAGGELAWDDVDFSDG